MKKKKPANPTTACANPVEEESLEEVEDNLDNDGEETNSDCSDSE